ncbi:IS1 family transposase [Candidatus Symbiopectobacterium sp.]|uniref:IS1 family transposase n=1 Tax=Candidatus Symbiopectobacterium sp. TaxID=2816440 RepID=UPI0025BA5251|nr:IS1 family transposase [Candidatus Symbiopectobacterium sp.]
MAKVAISVTVVSHANTDGYRAYNDELPKVKNIVSKLYTQRIECVHLTLRKALLNKSELVTTAPHTGRLLRDANTVRHS